MHVLLKFSLVLVFIHKKKFCDVPVVMKITYTKIYNKLMFYHPKTRHFAAS